MSQFGSSDNYHKLRGVLLSASNTFTTLNLTHPLFELISSFHFSSI